MKRTTTSNKTDPVTSGVAPILRGSALALVGLLGFGGSAIAAGVLQELTHSSGSGGQVEIVLTMSEPVGSNVPVFTTDTPPRIVIDLPETTLGLAQRRFPVGVGATSTISAAEAAGRTRVAVDLFRSAPYSSRTDGNRFILTVGGASTVAATAASFSADPAKRTANASEVANVDFRRTPEGAGRIIIAMTGDGAASDMRVDGQRVQVDLAGVYLPDRFEEQLDVVDFATPVQYIDVSRSSNGTRLEITTQGRFEPLAYQTGNEFIIEVDPVNEVIMAEDGTVTEMEEGYSGTPVTFNFQDIPVRTVLQLIAEESGLNIVASDSVSGAVTLRLINVPWDQALDLVLRAKSLDKRRDNNVIWVAPQAEITQYETAQADARIALEQRSELVTEYININYGSAEEIASLLTDQSKSGQGGGGADVQGGDKGFLSSRGSVSFDRRTNTLLLNDTPEKIAEIKNLIVLLDRPVDQVLIEARIVIASENFARELGAKFGVSSATETSNGTILATSGNIGLAGTGGMINQAANNRLAGRGGLGGIGGGLSNDPNQRLNVSLPVTNPTGSIGFAILGADYLLDLELSALESEGRGEVVSSPRVITANQREASIKQGEEIGYVTQEVTNNQVTTTVEYKEVVLELIVTPTITQDGRVYLVLNVLKDEISGFTATPNGSIPQIATREISTAVLVDDGQTVVIGGVYEIRSLEDLQKVPFLGDVPVLGNLFKNKARSTDKAELLIFVSPKILAVSGR